MPDALYTSSGPPSASGAPEPCSLASDFGAVEERRSACSGSASLEESAAGAASFIADDRPAAKVVATAE